MTAAEANALVTKLCDRFNGEAHSYGFADNAHAYMVGSLKIVLATIVLTNEDAAKTIERLTATE